MCIILTDGILMANVVAWNGQQIDIIELKGRL